MIQLFKSELIPLDFLEALRLSMNFGFMSKEELRQWALNCVRQNDSYDLFLLELIEGEKADAREMSFSIRLKTEGQDDVKHSKRYLLGELSRKLKDGTLCAERVTEKLDEIVFHLDFTEQESNRFYGIDYDLYFAKSGMGGDVQEVVQKLERVLWPYSQLRLNNYFEWKEINTQIDRAIKNT